MPLSAAQLRARLDFDDDRLLAECDLEAVRAGGPGGQHRNKVSTGIRLTHRPTGLIARAVDSRSQRENRLHALARLREAIAIGAKLSPETAAEPAAPGVGGPGLRPGARLPIPADFTWPAGVTVADGTLHVSDRNPQLPHVLALVLDAFAAAGGNPAEAAALLHVTSSSLTRFLAGHRAAWAEANRIRRAAGRPILRG